MKWASAVSDHESIEEAIDQCVASVAEELGSSAPDLAIVFASPHHAQDYDQLPILVRKRLRTAQLFGCSGGGIIGGGHEVENRPGFSLTAASLPEVQITPFHLDNEDLPDLDAGPAAWEKAVGISADKSPHFLLLTDPFSIRSESLVQGLDYAFSQSVKIGGMASGGQQHGDNVLVLGNEAYRSGAIGLALHGNIVVDTVVAQGCRPIGKPMHITASHKNVLLGLDGRAPVEVLRELHESLNERDQQLVRHSLFLGIVMDEFQEEPQLGDFLIRNIVGIDSRSGALAIGAMLQEGQIVQFHLRDARTSAEDLSALLSRYSRERKGESLQGALLFSCLGRGSYLYGRPDHDTDLFRSVLGNLPLGGFFCNGEIGPVRGTTYLHGYTSSFGVFRPRGK